MAKPSSKKSEVMRPEDAARHNFKMLEKEYGKLLAEIDQESKRDFLELANGLGQTQLADSRAGWIQSTPFGSSQADFSLGYDLPDAMREYLVKQSRAAAPLNRIVKQVVKLWVSFTVGQGIRPALGNQDPATVAEDVAGKSKAAMARAVNDRREKLGKVRAALDELWNSPTNAKTLSGQGVVRSAYRAAVDGELFFVVVESGKMSGQTTAPVRMIQGLEIAAILSNPDDADDIWYYLSRRPDPSNPGQSMYRLYPDWTQRSIGTAPKSLGAKYCNDLGITGALKSGIESAKVMAGNWVLHFPRESAGKRGNGLLFASLQWIQEFRRFMVSRIGIQQAIHRWAHKATAKGADQTTINTIISRLQSSIVGTGGPGLESNPGAAPGSTFVGNAGIDVSPMGSFETGASAAEIDGSMIKQEAAGMFPPHWIGDASSFRLATATALEMPLRAMLEMDQAYWRQVYSKVTEFALEVAKGIKRQDSEILIKFPALNNRQVAAFLTAFANLIAAAPEVAEEPESWAPIAAELNVEDPDSFTANLAGKAKIRNQKTQALAEKAAEKPIPAPGAGPGGGGAAPGKTRSDKSGQRGERSSTPKPARSEKAPT